MRDETLMLEGTPEEIDRVLSTITEFGLNYASGGRHYDIMGSTDKGKATRIRVSSH